MNKRMILYIQGAILLIEAAIMVLPIAAALIYREPSGIWFFYTGAGRRQSSGLRQ